MKTATLVLSCLFLAAPAHSTGGGSAYSFFGIGDLRYFPGTRSAGMGYTGLGSPGGNQINFMAPGTWSRITQTALSVEFLYEGYMSSNGSRSLYVASGTFNGSMLALPISTAHGIVFVGGFSPFCNVNYETFTGATQLGVEYVLHHVGTGGLGQGQAGLSYAPTKDLSIGASLNYLFGSVDRELTMSHPSETLAGGTVTNHMTARGITVTVGGLYTGLGELSEPLRRLSVGFRISSRGLLKTERRTTYRFTSEVDSSSQKAGRIAVPIAYGFGMGYQPDERYLLAADFCAQPWRDVEIDGEPAGLRNSFRWGVGAERIPSRDQTVPFLDRTAYRLGFAYHGTYYKVNGEGINEWAATGGFGVPVVREVRLNLAVEYGTRGTTAQGLIRDNILRFSLSVNIGEPWFIRYEEE